MTAVPLPVATPAHLDSSPSNSASSNVIPSSSPRNDDMEIDHSIAGLLKNPYFAPIMPQVFSFLSVIELMYTQQVNHIWCSHVGNARSVHIHKLHLGQFWSRIGVIDVSYFSQLCSSFKAVEELNLGYCHFITGDTLSRVVSAIPSYQRIEKLNLFYCYQLTDEQIIALLPLFPQLTDLNIGRCIKLTDKCIRAVSSQLPHLRSLTLSSLPLLTEETLMLFDDTSLFPSIGYLNLVSAGKYSVIEVDEVRNSRPGVKIVGPEEIHRIPDKNGKKQHNRKEINNET